MLNKVDVLVKYYELLDAWVRVAPDCVLPIKNLERALTSCYIEHGGAALL